MQRLPLVFFICIAIAEAAHGADSVVLGKGIRNEFVSSLPCPDDSICMDSMYLWTFAAKRTVTGPAVKGKVRFLAAQHTEAKASFVKSVELFVLRPIEDPELVKSCGAQYYLLSLSPRHEDGTYCISMRPETVGIELQPSDVSIKPNSGYYCFKKSLL